jgi:hypothetical protein
MFKESLVNGHLVIADQMIKSGFPFQNYSLPNVLLDVLRDSETTDDAADRAITFLNDRQYDLNSQDRQSWETGLHVAVSRQFLKTIETMITLGCDVNAVARDDIQPLHVADKIEHDSNRMTIIELLIKQ